MAALPDDYLERVYAGVLGKLIGVYLGRPFEGWTHQKIMEVLGPVRYFVHDHPELDVPLVVTDDDVSGTIAFVRALEEHGYSPEITSEQVGRTWLNQIVEGQTVLWWGGRGVSTEHTAYLNLREGIPAPRSGAATTNGRTVAEQIGAQIFIDGWAMVAPGRPELAALFAERAARVSHDGESVHAAMVWAAMEAEAFVSGDVDHLLDTGLRFIPPESAVARMIADVRGWARAEKDWLKTRQRIEDEYGYDKYHGVCHVMPNHAVMVMSLLYGARDFSQAMRIVNTCGWDTDCNSGNVGCLVALMHGMDSFSGTNDWRTPIADRALISSADGGYSINNAARIAMDVADIGSRMAGCGPIVRPKGGAQFHFSLPGSVQGFRCFSDSSTGAHAYVRQDCDEAKRPGLAINVECLKTSHRPVEVLTETFMAKDINRNVHYPYPLMASPLVYPGQKVLAKLKSVGTNGAEVQTRLRVKLYGPEDQLVSRDSEIVTIQPGDERTLEWTLQDVMDSQPIQSVGVAISVAEDGKDFTGKLIMDSLSWTGLPRMTLQRPTAESCTYWKRAWVNGVDGFHSWTGPSFCIVKNRGEGMIIQGTRDWTDYRVTVVDFTIKLGQPAGVAVRVRGLNRYYALMFVEDRGRGRRVALVKALDEKRIELASVDFPWELDRAYELIIQVKGDVITGKISDYGLELDAMDRQYIGGGLGLVVTSGSLSADRIQVQPAE